MSTDPSPLGPEVLAGLPLTRLLQLVSPALPIGAFAYSQGLEQAVADGAVSNEGEAADWALGLLEHSLGTLDLPILSRMILAAKSGQTEVLARWSVWLLASRPTAEMRAEDRQLGAALARTLEAIGVETASGWSERDDVTQAAMFAVAVAAFRIPTEVALCGFAFAWSELVAGAAVRLVPLGQSAGQRLIAAAGERIPEVVARALTLADDELGTAAPGQAIASALHETLYSRLFRS